MFKILSLIKLFNYQRTTLLIFLATITLINGGCASCFKNSCKLTHYDESEQARSEDRVGAPTDDEGNIIVDPITITIGSILGQLNEMMGKLSTIIEQVGGETRATILTLQGSTSQLIAEMDQTYGERYDELVNDLEEGERVAFNDAVALIEKTNSAITNIEEGALEAALITLREADITAYDTLQNIPCSEKIPRIAYAKYTTYRIWDDQKPRLTREKDQLRTDIITLRGNHMNSDLPIGTAVITGFDGTYNMPIVSASPNEVTFTFPQELIRKLAKEAVMPRSVAVNVSMRTCDKDKNNRVQDSLTITVLPPIKYSIHAQIRPMATVPTTGYRSFHFLQQGNSRCDDSTRVDRVFTVGPSPTVLDWKLTNTSQRCKSNVITTRAAGPYAVRVDGVVGGCGRTCLPPFSWPCNCEGSGLLGYTLNIKTQSFIDKALEIINHSTTKRKSSYSFPYFGKIPSGSSVKKCEYTLNIKVQNGEEEKIVELTEEIRSNEGFVSRPNKDTCSISLSTPASFYK